MWRNICIFDWKFYQITIFVYYLSGILILQTFFDNVSIFRDWSKLFSGWTMDRVSASRTEWQSLSNTKSTWSEWDEWVTYFSLNENWLELTWFAWFYLIFSPLESILLLSYFSKKLEIKFFLLIKQSLKLSLLS